MAYVPYVRVVARGTLRSSQTWSIGWSVHNDGTATGAEMFTYLGSMDGLVKTWLGGVIKTGLWDATTQFSTLFAYSYPAVGGAAQSAGLASAGVLGTGSPDAPSQLAACYSLRSGQAGRSGRGRFFLPVTTSGAFDANGQINSTTLGTASTQFKTFFDAAQVLTIGAAAAPWVIASRDSGSGAPIIGLQLGSKLRTQRRRTDKVAQDTNVVTVL